VDPLSVKRRLTCILAADAVGYSRQMSQDEEGTVRVLSAHRSVIDGIIVFHGGRVVSTAGDSVLAEFASAVEAVRSAVEIQEALKTRNDSLPEASRMRFRVGVNLGDVVVKDQDLLGDGVNVAARLETLAEPGGICISSSVYDQITGKLDLGFQDIGEQALKNISRPIRVFRVSGTAIPERHAPPTRPKRRQVSWGLGAVGVAALAAVVAWQSGWLQSSSKDHASPTSAPNVEVERIRAEAEAIKRQAEAELAKVRIDADASRATREKADSDAAAARIRAQAEADAARIRSEAVAAAARAKADSDVQLAKSAQATRKAEAKTTEAAAVAAAPVPAPAPLPEKTAAAPSAASTSPNRFDGTWIITNTCPAIADAQGFSYDFVAQVKDGYLRGDRRAEGSPGWLRIEGQIQADGSARLDARGLTDDPKFSPQGVAKGLPFSYHIAARFEGSTGTGKRLELRPCDTHYKKQ